MNQMTPQPVDLVIEARWVVPVEPHAVVLENHAVAVRDERIVALLPIAEARAAYAPRERVELGEHALIPGLVNSHTHNPMTLLRGLADDLPLMVWLQQHIWPAEAKVIGPEFVRDGVELAVAEMLRGGTTCANENYFFPDVIGATYRKLGFRAVVGLPVIEFPTAWAKSQDEYFERAGEVHDGFRGDHLVSTAFIRNLKNGRTTEQTMKSSDSFEVADVTDTDMQYLYSDGEFWHFMHQESFEQHQAGKAGMGDAAKWLKGEEECVVTLFNGEIIAVQPPNFVELKITETDPGVRGDTSGGGGKPATLETGAVVRVPLFVGQDEVIKVDTRTGEYVSRVK